jgi:type I restriction-modification system DNA methylase subunit
MFSALNIFKAIASLLVLWFCFNAGQKYERSDWQEREIKQIAAAAARIKELHEESRAKESLANVELNNVRDKLQEAKDEIENANSAINIQRDTIASLRWGATAMQANGSSEDTVAAPTRECDGETITELSPEVFGYVYEQFAKCDAIVEQLTAAQEVIELDREIANE